MSVSEDSTQVLSNVISRQEAMERFEALDASVQRILHVLSSGGQGTSHPVAQDSTAPGLSASGAEQEGHPATAPPFLPVSQDVGGAVLPAQGIAAALATPQGNFSPMGLEVTALPDSGGSLPVKVSDALPPVPSYLVEKIYGGKFIDFALLRPCNLQKLPTSEPSSAQIAKMCRSELAPVRNFVDWAEAWAVYTGVLASHDPNKVKDLIGYFLLLATASRDVPGQGWLDYDKAFRKLAEDNPIVNWGEASPTLWVTTVITKGSVKGSREPHTAQESSVLCCYRWNNGFCPNTSRCRYAHLCSVCRKKHPKIYCSSPPTGRAQAQGLQKREQSTSPPPKKKHKQ